MWAVPTEQGYYEPDVSELVRAKAYQQFGFGTYPTAVVFDKIDVVGSTRHPLYSILGHISGPERRRTAVAELREVLARQGWENTAEVSPGSSRRLILRRTSAAAVSGEPLPAPSAQFKDATGQGRERREEGGGNPTRGNYNVWDQDEPSKDWGRPGGLGVHLNLGCLLVRRLRNVLAG